jgi:hypothetical protein
MRLPDINFTLAEVNILCMALEGKLRKEDASTAQLMAELFRRKINVLIESLPPSAQASLQSRSDDAPFPMGPISSYLPRDGGPGAANFCSVHEKPMKNFGTKWLCEGPPQHSVSK